MDFSQFSMIVPFLSIAIAVAPWCNSARRIDVVAPQMERYDDKDGVYFSKEGLEDDHFEDVRVPIASEKGRVLPQSELMDTVRDQWDPEAAGKDKYNEIVATCPFSALVGALDTRAGGAQPKAKADGYLWHNYEGMAPVRYGVETG